MHPSTTIREMLRNKKIFVPKYQRAYSWETDFQSSISKKQVNVFLNDLDDYNNSFTKAKYYFGHFLYERKSDTCFGIIDGQQRLTTISIFVSAIFQQLKLIRNLHDSEKLYYNEIIKAGNYDYRFETVPYDNQIFTDYVIDAIRVDKNGIETLSAKRIVNAFDYFTDQLLHKDETYLLNMLRTVEEASCTTHSVSSESEAIQMFIFQNNRGKKPSNLEIVKAQFMYHIHLYGGEATEIMINRINNRFEEIYKSISLIENYINEDDVLLYTLKVHFNSLWESNPLEKINTILSKERTIDFIKEFTDSLSASFRNLKVFFYEHEKESIEVHSLITLSGISIAIPFILKAYNFDLSLFLIRILCLSLESIVLRHRLIGTRADITSRIDETFKEFTITNPDIQPIIKRIELLKTANGESWWFSYWNNDELYRALQGTVSHSTAKYLLWKYENHLENQGKNGYTLTRFNDIKSPELEHIAPQTPTNEEPIAAGYCEYDEEFRQQYINCLGNYLLLSKSHNCSVGNKPFYHKRDSYNHLAQQREIRDMTLNNVCWSKELISQRKKKIIEFILKSI